MKSRLVSSLVIASVVASIFIIYAAFVSPSSAMAQINSAEDPTSTNFSLVSCDGPALPADVLTKWQAKNPNKEYRICNFGGALAQVQRLINIAVSLGVLVAILLFSYAGYLLVSVSFTGKTDDVQKAKTIFQKVAIGFIIMLAAWFVVYQILDWLAADKSAATSLLEQQK